MDYRTSQHLEERAPGLRCDVLLVTATEVETCAVRDVFLQKAGIFERRIINDKTYFDLGVIGGASIFLVQSEMGAGGPGGATLVVHESIKALSPSAIVMVGIILGLLPQEQNIGDILISRQLVGYEMQKVDVGPDGQEVIKPRGDRPQASTRLLDRFRASIFDWQGPKIHFGLILSGDKLINNEDYRDKLLRIEPEAIGGEMEGTGVYAAAYRNKVDWILVKAICDWADGNKDQEKEVRQKQAAEQAARLTIHVLEQGGLTGNSTVIPSVSPGSNPVTAPFRRAIGTALRTYDIHSSWVVAVAWEPDGYRIASAGGDGLVRVWEAETGRTLLTYRGHRWRFEKVNMPPTIYNIAWSPEGLRLASAGDGTTVYVWDAATGQTIAIYDGHSGLLPNVFALAWSPDGTRIASGCGAIGTDKTVHVWDATNGQKLLHYNSSYGYLPIFSVSAVAWSPDGTRIASTCGDKTIRIWNATNGKHISTLKVRSDWVSDLAWSPDGRRIALANGDRTATVWDTLTAEHVLTYAGHSESVRDVAWSPDSTRLATASNDHTVHIWDSLSGAHIYTYRGHAKWATSLAWSPDGTRIASASNDMTVQIWQASHY